MCVIVVINNMEYYENLNLNSYDLVQTNTETSINQIIIESMLKFNINL